MDLSQFKIWLSNHKTYSDATIKDIISRIKRANRILEWYNDEVYQFKLEQMPEYQKISCSVRSQIKRAIKLYFEYINYIEDNEKKINLRALSMYANIGIAEAYLSEVGVDVVLANELIKRRADLYSKIYPTSKMVCGNINNNKVFNQIIKDAIELKVDTIIATPPCQGMSTAGQQDEDDERNKLICPVIKAIQKIKPKYVFIENVPLFLNTSIEVEGEKILIPELLKKELGKDYKINEYTIDTKDYSVPQTRERAIILMTRKSYRIKEWTLPSKDERVVTMRDAIGDLPILDPFVTDVSQEELQKMFPHYEERKKTALKISKWHTPPEHIKRQVVVMQHTPSGCTAFDNDIYFPVKSNGEAVKGYHNTYKRQNWDTAAYTVTMDNRKISSQNNVHPGRLEYTTSDGDNIYSDARTLTLYELMIIMSLPKDWPVPENTPVAFLRRIIGEGIPPLFVKKVFENLF